MDNENYFENLAKGKKKVNFDEEASPQETEGETAMAGEVEMGSYEASASDTNADSSAGNFEVELAKAETSVASRSARTARGNAAVKWEDDGEPEGQLTVDVYQTPEDIIVESAIAGVKPEDIDVNVTNDSISIRGARHHETAVKDGDYLYQECYWGRFARSIILPQEVDPENADVMFKNGILTIRLPKTNKKKSKKLRVRID